MNVKPGSRWKSAVCDTEIVVVRPPAGDVVLECGGSAMIAFEAAKPEGGVLASPNDTGTFAGKRYTDEAGTIELLCTKPGAGSLSVDGKALAAKDAKKLPSSD